MDSNATAAHGDAAELPLNWAALIEAVLLGGTGAMLLTKTLRGVLVFYIHPRFTPLVALCGIVLLLVAGVRMRAIFGGAPEPLRGRGVRYLVPAFALLLGTLVPTRPLGAETLSRAMLGATLPARPSVASDGDTRQWDLLQWALVLPHQAEALQGRAADVVGFVYHDPARAPGGFIVARYVISCCTADSNGAGLAVVWPDAAPPADTWVRVRGAIGTATVGGQPKPALLASAVEPVAQPADPYLYLTP